MAPDRWPVAEYSGGRLGGGAEGRAREALDVMCSPASQEEEDEGRRLSAVRMEDEEEARRLLEVRKEWWCRRSVGERSGVEDGERSGEEVGYRSGLEVGDQELAGFSLWAGVGVKSPRPGMGSAAALARGIRVEAVRARSSREDMRCSSRKGEMYERRGASSRLIFRSVYD